MKRAKKWLVLSSMFLALVLCLTACSTKDSTNTQISNTGFKPKLDSKTACSVGYIYRYLKTAGKLRLPVPVSRDS